MNLKEKLKNYWSIVILALILLLGLGLRLYHLGSHPPGLTWDEAALGYNAYSIIKTARDEHGQLLPLIFKSFGDYKPGLYVYLTTPFVAFLGLTSFSVRLPSALFGTLAIYGLYLTVKQLFSSPKGRSLALISAFILSVSPWHLHFSHAAWEVNVFTTLILFALYFFLRFIKKDSPLWPSIVLATLTFFVYQGAKMLTPLVFLLAALVYRKALISRLLPIADLSKKDLYVTVFCALVAIVLFIVNLTGSAGNRLQRLSILGYRPPISQETKTIDQNNPLTLKLFHHQIDLPIRLVFGRYLHHFSPELLFYSGKLIVERGHLPKQGMLYLLDFIWLALGFAYLFNLVSKKNKSLLLGLLLLAPLPAALTIGEASTVRALFIVVPLSILIGLGIKYLSSQKWLFIPLLLAYLLNIVLGLDIYFNHSAPVLAEEFNYGYKQAVEVINNHPCSLVVFTDVYGQPYIYYLFYSQYPPAQYQAQDAYIDRGIDVGRVGGLDKISFQQFSSSEIKHSSNTIFIGTTGNIPDSFDPSQDFVDFYQQITLPDSQDVVFRIIKTK